MSRHGRATMPWGKFKGVRVRLLPDEYLSFLTQARYHCMPDSSGQLVHGPLMLADPKWRWLKDSVIAELRFRGFREDLADSLEQVTQNQPVTLSKIGQIQEHPRRSIAFE